jgi:hypothetical protein
MIVSPLCAKSGHRPSPLCHRLEAARLPKPLFHISGKVFEPAQGSNIDLHMLTVFFHDRQIEQELVERIRTIHVDDNDYTPQPHTFPDVDD